MNFPNEYHVMSCKKFRAFSSSMSWMDIEDVRKFPSDHMKHNLWSKIKNNLYWNVHWWASTDDFNYNYVDVNNKGFFGIILGIEDFWIIIILSCNFYSHLVINDTKTKNIKFICKDSLGRNKNETFKNTGGL